jgi:hypothetical protein
MEKPNRIALPADAAAAERIREALIEQGLDVRLIVDEIRDGKVELQLEVPPDQLARCRTILATLDDA